VEDRLAAPEAADPEHADQGVDRGLVRGTEEPARAEGLPRRRVVADRHP